MSLRVRHLTGEAIPSSFEIASVVTLPRNDKGFLRHSGNQASPEHPESPMVKRDAGQVTFMKLNVTSQHDDTIMNNTFQTRSKRNEKNTKVYLFLACCDRCNFEAKIRCLDYKMALN